MTNEQYIEHEVQLRLLNKTLRINEKQHDKEHQGLDKRFDRLEGKLNAIMTMIVGGFLLPAVLHYLGWL